MKSNKKRVTSQIRIPVDLFSNLKIRAFKQNLTLSRYVEGVLRKVITDTKVMNIVNK